MSQTYRSCSVLELPGRPTSSYLFLEALHFIQRLASDEGEEPEARRLTDRAASRTRGRPLHASLVCSDVPFKAIEARRWALC